MNHTWSAFDMSFLPVLVLHLEICVLARRYAFSEAELQVQECLDIE